MKDRSPGRSAAFLIVAVAVLSCLRAASAETRQFLTVQANCVTEVTLTTERTYPNPFMEITLDALITAPDGRQFKVPAFWAGGNAWRFRYASGSIGTHTYRTECSDTTNSRLHGVEGKIEVVPYAGDNPLYRHGPIRVARDQRHFQHADGTPFFWLGDTWWKGLCKRIPLEDFQRLTADRKAKGFTVVQIIGGGPYPDEPPFDSRWENEAGMPYEKNYVRINPAYFDHADRRIECLIDAGIVPAIVGGWGWHMPAMGVEKMNRHWRYLIARYGAYPVVWIVAGEMQEARWVEVARYVRKADPYHRLATMHPPGIPQLQSGRKALNVELLPGRAGRLLTLGRDRHDDTLLDFDLLQTAHNDWATAPITVSQVTASYSKTPAMPVVDGEVVYEWHKRAGQHDVQRFMFWSCMLNGAAGHTYGAGGIWEMNSATVRGSDYDDPTWSEAMRFPGSSELGLGKKLLEEYAWWRFAPHPEWVEPRSTTLFEPHWEWYDNHRKWRELNGRWDLPYAAGIPGVVRFVYIPAKTTYQLTAPTVVRLEPGMDYRVFLFDPVWGKRFDLGRVPASGPADGYQPPQLPSPQDWVLVLERVKQ